MNDHEIRLAQSRIVECRFQQQRIAAALSIESPGALDAVNVNGQAKSSRFARDVEEKKILKRFVIACRRFAATNELQIHCACSNCVRIIEIELAQISSFILDRYGAVF